MIKKIVTLMIATFMVMPFTGCGNQKTATQSKTVVSSGTSKANTKSGGESAEQLPDLKISFGAQGSSFQLHLYNNDTAIQIAKDVGEQDWNLPMYHYNDFKNSDVMQYYDIASSYTFTSKPETVTSEKAGEVYYSAPNRMILFYQDAKVQGKFTKVGYLENTNGLKAAVEKNPVIEGWGDKIISISPAK